MTPNLKARTIKVLTWMIEDMKWRADDLRSNTEEGSHGGYSEELTEAIELLEELKK